MTQLVLGVAGWIGLAIAAVICWAWWRSGTGDLDNAPTPPPAADPPPAPTTPHHDDIDPAAIVDLTLATIEIELVTAGDLGDFTERDRAMAEWGAAVALPLLLDRLVDHGYVRARQ